MSTKSKYIYMGKLRSFNITIKIKQSNGAKTAKFGKGIKVCVFFLAPANNKTSLIFNFQFNLPTDIYIDMALCMRAWPHSYILR